MFVRELSEAHENSATVDEVEAIRRIIMSTSRGILCIKRGIRRDTRSRELRRTACARGRDGVFVDVVSELLSRIGIVQNDSETRAPMIGRGLGE